MHWRMRPLVLSPVCVSQPSDRIHFNCHGHHLPDRMDTSLPTRSRTSLLPSELMRMKQKKRSIKRSVLSSPHPVTNFAKNIQPKMFTGACARKFVSNHAQSPPIGHLSFSRDYNLIHDTGIHIDHSLSSSFLFTLSESNISQGWCGSEDYDGRRKSGTRSPDGTIRPYCGSHLHQK